MPSIIKPLPDLLVNKIAAGEVIERPANVVKELLENAIDAGAKHVDIAVEEGGKRLIRVTDDGGGMSAEDLPLAVRPHATSKLANEDDLMAIRTMGFRGEALASIASVSETRVVSRQADQPAGAELVIDGGQMQPVRSAGCPVGTTIEVANLFFNMPARRKFLRGGPAEMSHISEQVARIALAQPRLGVTVSHNGRVVRRMPADQGRLDRIASLYGQEMSEALVQVDHEGQSMGVRGWIARPQHSRASGKWQYTFVNGRYVRDRFLLHAIKEAYRSLIEPSRFPPVFVFVELPPDQIDVNVHPTKIEIRWRDSNLVHSEVLSAIRETLRAVDLTPNLQVPTSGPADTAEPSPRQGQVRQAINDYLTRQQSSQPQLGFGEPRRASRPTGGPPASHAPHETGRPAGGVHGALGGSAGARPARQRDLADWAGSANPPSPDHSTPTPDQTTPATEPEAPSRGAVQLHNAYLVCESEDGIVIIDQHALHERVLYEQIKTRLADGKLESQRLLLPEPVRATPEHAAAAKENGELLDRLGIELAPFGPDTLAVQAFPGLLANIGIGEFITDLLDKLVDQGKLDGEALLHEVMEMMACKAAIKAGQQLSVNEIDALIAQRHLAERSSNCPHGRPTSLQFSRKELEKQFKRT